MASQNNGQSFKKGDVVFAKVRGHCPWPAKITAIDSKTFKNAIKYKVYFFGTKETNTVGSDNIFSYRENKINFSKNKKQNEKFQFALSAADKSVLQNSIIKNNFQTIDKNESMDIGTPQESSLNITSDVTTLLKLSTTAVQNQIKCSTPSLNAEKSFSDKAVNTPDYMSSSVQLDSLTKECMSLHLSLLEKDEQKNSESESIEHDSSSISNGQAQVLLEELNKFKNENKSLNTIVTELNYEILELNKQLSSAKSYQFQCPTCYPTLNQPFPSTSRTTQWQAPKNPTTGARKAFKSAKPQNVLSENQFEVLTEANETPHTDEKNYSQASDEKIAKPKMTRNNTTAKKKLLLCSDSHGRDMTWHLNARLKSHESVGFVRPGGRSEQVLDSSNIEKENLKKDDILVLITGTNDVARNEASKAVQCISSTIDKFSKKNKIVLVELPTRYDLADWSCVNKEVRKTNNILKDLSEKNPNVFYVGASLAERNLHTQQGLHFNRRGKEWLAEEICSAIKAQSEDVSRGPGGDTQLQSEQGSNTESDLGNSMLQDTHRLPDSMNPQDI